MGPRDDSGAETFQRPDSDEGRWYPRPTNDLVAVRILLLGAVEARIERGPLDLGGPRPRTVLAVLALHARAVVSSDQLVDALWGGHPPAGADNALQVVVSRLRKQLPGGSRLLATRRPGYALEVDTEQVDALRFERLAADGRVALEAGEHASAAGLLREALGLWR